MSSFRYAVTGSDTGYATAGNYAEIKAATGKPLNVLEIRLNQILRKGDAQAEMLHLQLRRFTAALG
ncbi:MAG: hypothetical protein KAJ19_20090, partial [Gammaproteobacteria bacterium]|nr:hypothetical protein [Gammaproteobacteria bacterium]